MSGDAAVVSGTDCTSLAAIQDRFLAPQCALSGCHLGATAAAALDFTLPNLQALLVSQPASSCANQTLVVPQKPDASFLLTKMTGHVPQGCGDPMPPGGGGVSSDLLACVRTWIGGLGAGSSGSNSDGGTQTCETCGGSTCVDLASDALHCGACDTPCASSATCSGGSCTCGRGLTPCAGACVDTTTDPNNCQGCGVRCSTSELCTPSGCSSTVSCGALVQCGSACVDTQTSTFNCGTCGHSCPSQTTCSGGTCVCDNGDSLCGATCVDTLSDANNCGGCGIVCGAAESCVMGSCGCAGGQVVFADVSSIFVNNCTNAGCHTGAAPKEGLNLTASKAYAGLVGVKAAQCSDGRLRVPTDGKSTSYLLQKLYGQGTCSGTSMPKAGVLLPPSDLSMIKAWICNGAKP